MRAKVLGETVLDPAADLAEADLGLRGAREAAAHVEQLQVDPEPLRGEEHGVETGSVIIMFHIRLQTKVRKVFTITEKAATKVSSVT